MYCWKSYFSLVWKCWAVSFIIVIIIILEGVYFLILVDKKLQKKRSYLPIIIKLRQSDIFQVSRGWYKPQKLKPAIPLASMALNLDHHDNRIYKWRIASISISIKCFFTQLFCQIFPNDSQNLSLIQGHYLGSDNSRIFFLYMPQAHVKACVHYFLSNFYFFTKW